MLTTPFRYGHSRDTSYLPLFLQSFTERDPTTPSSDLLAILRTPLADRTERKSAATVQWIEGMSYDVTVACKHQRHDLVMSCVVDCTGFSRPVAYTADMAPTSKAEVTDVVMDALPQSIKSTVFKLQKECTRCNGLRLCD